MDYFTLEQAIALLPWLREQLQAYDALLGQQGKLQVELERLQQRVRSNGHSSHAEEAGALRSELEGIEGKQAAIARSIAERGILLRDPQRGLVDFLAMRAGREVYLCWLKGEDTIRFWHDLDTGFSGRKPL